MSTFCTFETEYRLTRIDQSFRHLSLRCTWCNHRKCGFIWISCGTAGSDACEVARDICACDAIGGPWIHFQRIWPALASGKLFTLAPRTGKALYSGGFTAPRKGPPSLPARQKARVGACDGRRLRPAYRLRQSRALTRG